VAYAWAGSPVDIAWHPLGPDYATEAGTPLCRVWVGSTGRLRVPLGLDDDAIEVWQGAHARGVTQSNAPMHLCVGQGAARVSFAVEDGHLLLDVDQALVGHWLYVMV